MNNHRTHSLLLLVSLGLLWGTGYSIARFAVTHGVSPLGYSFWQSLGPALLLMFISKLFHSSHPIIPQPANKKANFQYYLVCALTGIVIPNTNMYFAAQHLPAGLLAVIVNTVPIMAYPMALLSRTEEFCITRLTGVLLAVTGLMLIVIPKASLPSPALMPWVLSTLITPLSFAFCSVYIAHSRPIGVSSIQSAAGTLLLSSLVLAPVIIYSGNFYSLHLPLTFPDKIILLEILLSSVGYIIFFKLIKVAGPVYYSFVDTLVSLTGLMWGYVLFHERLNQWTAGAVLLILFALMLVNKTTMERKLHVKTSSS